MTDSTTKFTLTAAITLGMLLVSTFAGASEQAQATAQGDPRAGQAIAGKCVTCHGDDVTVGPIKMPHLAGQHADYITKALTAYRSGERNEDNMHAVAGALSDQDILDLAAYFAGLAPIATHSGIEITTNGDRLDLDKDPYAAVREGTAPCAGCHGVGGNSATPGMPGLAGQHPQYLIAALKAYRDGARPDPMMQAFAAPLEDRMIEDMAFYYAAIKPVAAESPTSGDPYAGRAATRDCVTCHGNDGNTKDPKTPRLAGLDASYIAAAIVAYKGGERSHAAMQDAVAAVRDADIADISAFYATKAPKALPIRKRLTTAEWVENCNRCHGPNGKSTDPRFPILAGQSESYLIKALKHYHDGDRSNSMMIAMSYPMSESDIRKLAAYYAAQKPD